MCVCVMEPFVMDNYRPSNASGYSIIVWNAFLYIGECNRDQFDCCGRSKGTLH